MEVGEDSGLQAWLNREHELGEVVSIRRLWDSAHPDKGEIIRITDSQIIVIRAANERDIAREIKFDRATGLSTDGRSRLIPYPGLQGGNAGPQEIDSRYFLEYRESIYLTVLRSYSTAQPPLVPREYDIVVLREFPALDSTWRVKEVIQYPPNRVVVLVNEWESSAVSRLARLEDEAQDDG